jgi:predicted Zn-dependent protease
MMVKDNSPRSLISSLDLLRQAMNYDPVNPHLMEAIIQACLRASKSDNQELKVLKEAIVQGLHSDTAHFILGTIAINEGRDKEAMYHLEISAKSNPNLPGVLNNLAYLIANSDSPDLQRALRLSNAAIQSLPNHPYLRETRGQIHLKLGNYTEAIADLEMGLSAVEIRPSIRRGLKEAYTALGQDDIAKRQQELLDQGK